MPVSIPSFAFLGLVAGLALVGCESAPEPASPAAMARKQHALAVARASEYCRQKGLAMRSGSADAPTRPGQVATDFQFRCVKAQN